MIAQCFLLNLTEERSPPSTASDGAANFPTIFLVPCACPGCPNRLAYPYQVLFTCRHIRDGLLILTCMQTQHQLPHHNYNGFLRALLTLTSSIWHLGKEVRTLTSSIWHLSTDKLHIWVRRIKSNILATSRNPLPFFEKDRNPLESLFWKS